MHTLFTINAVRRTCRVEEEGMATQEEASILSLVGTEDRQCPIGDLLRTMEDLQRTTEDHLRIMAVQSRMEGPSQTETSTRGPSGITV